MHVCLKLYFFCSSLDFYCNQASESCEKLSVWIPSYEIVNKRKELIQRTGDIAVQQAEAQSKEDKYKEWLKKLSSAELHYHRPYAMNKPKTLDLPVGELPLMSNSTAIAEVEAVGIVEDKIDSVDSLETMISRLRPRKGELPLMTNSTAIAEVEAVGIVEDKIDSEDSLETMISRLRPRKVMKYPK